MIARNLASDQDAQPIWQRDNCFGCGSANLNGLQLKFALRQDGKVTFANCHSPAASSGRRATPIIATILDEAMSKANKLKANELKTKVTLTRRIEVEYLRPVPLEQPLVAQGQVSRMKGRVLHNSAELRNAKGEVLARSRGVFLAIDAEKIFASEFENERRSAR